MTGLLLAAGMVAFWLFLRWDVRRAEHPQPAPVYPPLPFDKLPRALREQHQPASPWPWFWFEVGANVVLFVVGMLAMKEFYHPNDRDCD